MRRNPDTVNTLGSTRHTMLGAGGRIVEPRSEGGELSAVLGILTSLANEEMPRSHHMMLASVISRLGKLQGQVAAGYHRNPAITGGFAKFAAGHAVGQIGVDTHEIRYTHKDDGDNYRHVFGEKVEIWAIQRGDRRDVLLTHKQGEPLWEDI